MPLLHPDALWRLATAQWAEITAHLPNLAPAVALQQRLLRIMIDASAAVYRTEGLQLDSASMLEKSQRGLPALRNETVPIPPALKECLVPLCTALAEGGAGESALHIRDALISHDIDADSLLSVSLARNQKAVRTSALHMGFAPDLVWLIGELGSAPLAHHLSGSLRGSVGQWDRGHCPFCGSWPALVEYYSGAYTLRCSYCSLGWALQTHRCAYCRNDGDDFIAAAPDISRPQRRVELCGRCSGYTKVIEVEGPIPFPLVAVADLATMDLDEGAMSRGYRRPELFDFDTIEPRTSTC